MSDVSSTPRKKRTKGNQRLNLQQPPPKKTTIFFDGRFMAARHEKGGDESNIFIYVFLFAKDHRTMTSGWQGKPHFRRYSRELVSKPAVSLSKSRGGCSRTTLWWYFFFKNIHDDMCVPTVKEEKHRLHPRLICSDS